VKLTSILNTVIYYILLLGSLIYVSWIIWARFIRERTIREIPDFLLTEYRFWILLYICAIYLYMIKSLIKPKKENIIPPEIIDYIYRPLTLLDRNFKYNKYIISYYNKKSQQIVTILNELSNKKIVTFILAMRIFPRLILALFLFVDTFYFCKLEIFYKVILIGLLPFIYRYIKYSIKDIYNYWVEKLEDTYSSVLVFEEGYEYEFSRTRDTRAKYHYKRILIKEFLDLQYETNFEFCSDKIDYCYVGDPYTKDHLVETYARNKYNDQDAKLTTEDYDNISKLFHDLYPLIINLKLFLNRLKLLEDKPVIKYPRILIYSIYIICWSFILVTSYYHYPIDLPMFKILIKNLIMYLKEYDLDQFSMLNQHSINENLITPDNVCNLFKSILNKIVQIIKNKLS
jgi:hypothetical protein